MAFTLLDDEPKQGKFTLMDDEPKGYVDRRIDAVKSVFNPETYRQIGRELTNFPSIQRTESGKVDVNATAVKQVLQSGEELGMMASPVTNFSKASRMAVNPLTGNSNLNKLVSEGVTPTFGQRLGGPVKRTEEALTSIPILGDVIKSAQRRGIEEFNTAAINRTLHPIGKSLPKNAQSGHAAVDFAHQSLSEAYDNILPKLKGRFDDNLANGIKSVDDFVQTLPESQARQLKNIIQQNVISKFDDAGNIEGEGLKEVQSRLGKLIRQFGKSENPDHQIMSEALESVKGSLDEMLSAMNPGFADKLKAINSGYANLVRVEKAAASTGAKGGVFTPSQLNQAVKATDSSVRKNRFARGGSLMQDLSTSGQDVLSQTLPDSGTALRLAPYLVAGGAGVGGETGYLSPEVASTIAALSLAYSRPGQAAINKTGSVLSNPSIQRLIYGAGAANGR